MTGQVYGCLTRKYSHDTVFDTFERIIKEEIKHNDDFDCSRDNISKKILLVHDVKRQEVLSLMIGPYAPYRNTVLEKFCNRISTMIYETGFKTEILEILFSVVIKEMKNRFDKKGSGYSYIGVEGVRDEGIIKVKD